MNPRLDRLHAYPFERLARLKAGINPPAALAHIAMSIGEPQHAPPAFVLDSLRENLHRLGSYPATAGLPELRAAAARWLERRFGLQRAGVNPAARVHPETMVLPCNGTREALFSFVQALVDDSTAPVVAMPNPFYQIYEGAALLAGAEPHFLNTTAATGYLPDLDAVGEQAWRRCQVLFLCSPGNPTGAVLPVDFLRRALTLAERHDFVVAADECYTEIYLDEGSPPPGLLQAAITAGHDSFERCVVFHSLSKRSSLPGLRSGFVAGDPKVMSRFLLYRTYHGSAMPVPTQLASIAAWNDDVHAAANRRLYQEKFDRVIPILSDVLQVERPSGGFYLWSDVRGDDERFTRDLFAQQNVTVLPGSYLSRGTAAGGGTASAGNPANPGAGRVRISLVPGVEQCIDAAERIREFIRGHR
ncbi:MAG: succinyldiaminopimelate transaminase [Steroidobacteraceae bacterium]